MLEHGKDKILPIINLLVIPIKNALQTKSKVIVVNTLKKLQKLVLSGDAVGEGLVPFYRQILPVFNLLKHRNLDLGDKIDYHQRCEDNVGELIQQTLELFEKHGGEDAFINIKYMVPTYESCLF